MRTLEPWFKRVLPSALLAFVALAAEAQFGGPNVAEIDRARAQNELLAAQARQVQAQNELVAAQTRQAQLQSELLAEQLKQVRLQTARLEQPCEKQ
jgi:hypothetical protein